MARVAGPHAEHVYGAAQRFVHRALRSDGGLFAARSRTWSPEVVDGLRTRLAGRPATPGTPFAQAWVEQLAGADPLQIQLAAEAVFVHLLFPAEIGSAAKHRVVEATRALSPEVPPLPPWGRRALRGGLARTGPAYHLRRRSQLALLLDAVAAWKRLPPRVRREHLDDTAGFKAWLATVPHDGAQAQREALAHLVHPDAFEPIVSPAVKTRIVAAFREHVHAGTHDVDAALHAIRSALTPVHGPGFSFVDPPLVARWRDTALEPSPGGRGELA